MTIHFVEQIKQNHEVPKDCSLEMPKGVMRMIKISFSKKEGIKKKVSYERRVYESVDDESLS